MNSIPNTLSSNGAAFNAYIKDEGTYVHDYAELCHQHRLDPLTLLDSYVKTFKCSDNEAILYVRLSLKASE